MDENTKVQLLEAVLVDPNVREHLHELCGVARFGQLVVAVVDGDKELLPLLLTPEDLMSVFTYEVVDLPFVPNQFPVEYNIGDPLAQGINWECGWPALHYAFEHNLPLPDRLQALVEQMAGQNPFNARLSGGDKDLLDELASLNEALGDHPLLKLLSGGSGKPDLLDLLGMLMDGEATFQSRIIAIGMTRDGQLFAELNGDRTFITSETLEAALTADEEEKPYWLEPLERGMNNPNMPQWVRDAFAS